MNELSRTGLRADDIELIVGAAKRFPEIRQLVLFGSRAKGSHKPGSDVDLAIKGNQLTYDTPVRLAGILNEELPLPYFFDVVDYETITERQLAEHIDRVGIVLLDQS
ncbi:polymerase beta, Nucleotidyltransferase [anaerobic digester metagenome]